MHTHTYTCTCIRYNMPISDLYSPRTKGEVIINHDIVRVDVL